jgi:ribonucleoside-diphosphate reductase, beta subunit
MGIFDKRLNYKPFEYPEILQFVDSMNQTFWVHKEVEFTADIQDFKSNLSEKEKEVVKRSLLSIAQVEVAVKTFWGDLYKYLPKPEFNGLGATFSESEFRHSEAYSRLLEVLGYNNEFEGLMEVPIFKKKLELFEKHFGKDISFVQKLLFFVIVIENTSLFSQFANILSFTRFKGYMKNTANIIAWTSVDEQTHANAGVYILNKIFEEYPEERYSQEHLEEVIKDYVAYESELLDWIYEKGQLSFYTKEDMLNFMKYRVDTAITHLNYNKIYNITGEQYSTMKWFDEDVFANELDDFFAKRPTAYTKHDKSITENDLF